MQAVTDGRWYNFRTDHHVVDQILQSCFFNYILYLFSYRKDFLYPRTEVLVFRRSQSRFLTPSLKHKPEETIPAQKDITHLLLQIQSSITCCSIRYLNSPPVKITASVQMSYPSHLSSSVIMQNFLEHITTDMEHEEVEKLEV